jgi:hypothetical protein
VSWTSKIDCRDCEWVADSTRPSCIAPQLRPLGDGAPGKVPHITDCEGVRYFKSACGYEARWFVKKGGLNGS